MSEQPYIEDGWLCEPVEPDYAPGVDQAIPGSWSEPLVNLTELHGYDEMIAAAEQRGAEKALQDFKRFTTRIMPSRVLRADLIADLEESLGRLSKDRYLLMGPLRADSLKDAE